MSQLLKVINFESNNKAYTNNSNFECHSYKKILILKPAISLIQKVTNFEHHSYKNILILKAAIRPIQKLTNIECHSY